VFFTVTAINAAESRWLGTRPFRDQAGLVQIFLLVALWSEFFGFLRDETFSL